MITSVSTGGSGGEDRLTENVTLNFAKVEWYVHAAKRERRGGQSDARRLEHRRKHQGLDQVARVRCPVPAVAASGPGQRVDSSPVDRGAAHAT